MGLIAFQSTRPVRGGTLTRAIWQRRCVHFNPPAPCGAGPGKDHLLPDLGDFNPPAPCGAGRPKIPIAPPISNFNPPAPCGAGPEDEGICAAHQKFQSTRPVRGGTVLGVQTHIPKRISIHPPRAGRDGFGCTNTYSQTDFNPPAPCGAGHDAVQDRVNELLFQSTRPVRGGTGTERSYRHKQPVISIHPPRAGRDPPFLWHLSPQR